MTTALRIALQGCKNHSHRRSAVHCLRHGSRRSMSSIAEILASVKSGSLSIKDAQKLIQDPAKEVAVMSPGETLQSFANLDHTRSLRTGFPEVVFAETKTPRQVAMIMDDMARHVNETIEKSSDFKLPKGASAAILATR